MKSNRASFIFIALLACLAAACNLGSAGNTSAPEASSTEPPTILMQDDFSDPKSGWTVFSDEEGINDYHEGGFRILVNRENYYFWSNPGRSYSDVIIEVNGKKLAGPDENDYGVICRYQEDAGNFYFFTIGSDGYYGVSKYINDEESLIGMSEMGQNTSVILGGDEVNHIKVTCKGTSLTLEVNGTILVDVKDEDLTSGDIGLIAGTYDSPGVDVLFDDLVVSKP